MRSRIALSVAAALPHHVARARSGSARRRSASSGAARPSRSAMLSRASFRRRRFRRASPRRRPYGQARRPVPHRARAPGSSRRALRAASRIRASRPRLGRFAERKPRACEADEELQARGIVVAARGFDGRPGSRRAPRRRPRPRRTADPASAPAPLWCGGASRSGRANADRRDALRKQRRCLAERGDGGGFAPCASSSSASAISASASAPRAAREFSARSACAGSWRRALPGRGRWLGHGPGLVRMRHLLASFGWMRDARATSRAGCIGTASCLGKERVGRHVRRPTESNRSVRSRNRRRNSSNSSRATHWCRRRRR